MFGLMVLSQPLKLFDTVPSAPMIMGMTLTLLQFNILISSHFKSLYLSHFSFSFYCIQISNWTATSIIRQVLFYLSRTTMSGLLCFRSLSVCILKFHNIFTCRLSATDSGLCSYHFYAYGRSFTLHNSQ